MATLTTTINEAVTLNGTRFGSTISQTITDLSNVSTGVTSVSASSEATLLTFGAATAGSTVIATETKYIRITNLDTTNYIALRIQLNNNAEFMYKVTAGNTFILNKSDAAADADGSAITVSWEALKTIKAQADTASVNVETFVATTS